MFWGIKGVGELLIDGKSCILGRHQVAVYCPNDMHRIGTDTDWEYRWWTMDGLMAEQVTKAFGLFGPWPREAGVCPVDLFVRLAQEIGDVSATAEYRATATAYELLAHAGGRALLERVPASPGEALAGRGRELMEQRFADPAISVESIARELGRHRSVLTREFKKRFGMSPIAYLQSKRLQKGFAMLRETPLSVSEIAYCTGFSDPAYFSRCVARATGMPPSRLRESGKGWALSPKGD